MRASRLLYVAIAALAAASSASAGFVVDYATDAGGSNPNPLNGLSARATFSLSGTTLTVLLENTSTGVPVGFDASDSLLTSLGFTLSGGVSIVSGDSSLIGPGSIGIGAWSGAVAGDSIADQWVWSNDGAGDMLDSVSQVITTSNGLGGAAAQHFTPGTGNISGPFGGIAAAPPVIGINSNQDAVSNSILFTLTLSDLLSETDLMQAILASSMVEFGSDVKYLRPVVPEPNAAALAVLGTALLALRRRS